MRNIAFALILVAAAASAADNPETLAERSQSRAREVLDKAVAAIGGADALQDIQRVRLHLSGKTWPRLQMTTADPPFESGTFDETLLFDLTNNRLRLEQRADGAGFEGNNVVLIKSGEGTNYDLRARTTTPIPAAQTTQQQFIQYYRRIPNLLLRQALANPNSLRYLGDDQLHGRKHDVITFVMPDTQQVALYVDSTSGLVSKYELIITDPLAGEDASEILFADYKQTGNLKVPQTWTWRIAGDTVARYAVDAQFNPPVDDKSFEFADAGFTRVTPPPATLAANVEKLADGVYVFQNIAGQNQNTMAVELSDSIVAIEAPGTSAGADAVIKRIKETIPGKPIRYVVVTHHHGDHIGGLRSFIAEGATVVTVEDDRRIIEAMANAPQKDTLAASPRKPEFLFLTNGKRVLSDGQRSVEVIDIGPNPHARHMLIAYLPKERVVFQGDLFFAPQNDAPFGPPQRPTISFAEELIKRGIIVDKIASVHGRTATVDEFSRATKQPATAAN